MPRTRYEVSDATAEEVQFVADNARSADRQEIKALVGWDVPVAAHYTVVSSPVSRVGKANGVPIVAFGVSLSDPILAPDIGTPWLFGTPAIERHWVRFLRECPGELSGISRDFSRLENWVHADNELAIRWLTWLGFTIEEPEPHGLFSRMFRRFHMEC